MTGYLYSDDVSMQTGGSPGTYTNSLNVGSVENDGAAGEYFNVAGQNIVYAQTTGYANEPLTSLAGTQEYVYIDGCGTYDNLDPLWDVIEGRILVCSWGSISFYEKAMNAVDYGAIGTIIYNNTDGMIYMDLSSYEYGEPCVSIRQADGAFLKENAEECVSDDGGVYYLGTMEIAEGYGVQVYYSDHYTMSDFSSWGVPGSLEMKPEITAPGGSIYSVDGSVAGGQAYEVMSGTSMAAPQVAGMAALVAQYIKEKGLDDLSGLTVRNLSQSLLMSTAQPLVDGSTGSYWSVLQQGAGLANVGSALAAQSYILMGEDATASWADGKVKVELGDDPDRDGVYNFSFSINNLTDAAQKYALSAGLFTQGLFRYYVNEAGDIGYYMDTATAALDASAVWTVDGKVVQPGSAADFDGDGDSDGDDCDALLAYIAGELESIHDLDKADYDGDGSVTSYDAYLFLLDTGVTAEVPANGSVTVSVKLTLSKAQKAFLDDYYTAGAYIEGYICAEAANTAEGVEGTSHSVPVLGFYGDWSEPSMYEVGSQVAYSTGSETRLPYAGDENANYVSVKYADLGGKSYYFGGNPIFSDSEYHSERNAINSLRDSFDELGFMLIRNAAAGRVAVCKDGQVVYEEDLGAVASAFYYVNGGLNSTATVLTDGAADTLSASETTNDGSVIVKLTAQDAQGSETGSNSGLLVVHYDSSLLTLAGCDVYTAHYGLYDDGNGTLTIAYADLDTVSAGDPVAKLTFARTGAGETQIRVTHAQTDRDLDGTAEEVLSIGTTASEHLDVIYIPGSNATCTAYGNVECWYCADCGKYFADAACTEELAPEEVLIAPVAHELAAVDAVEPTCEENGCVAHQQCLTCGGLFDTDGCAVTEADVILEALGHVRLLRDMVPATDTEPGYTGDVYCGRCGALLEEGKEIPVKNSMTLDEALNLEGGTLKFKTDSDYPWTVETDYYGNAYAVSGNQEVNDSESMIWTQVYLKKGQTLEFSWKASCETYGDYLWFYVNGVPVTGICATDDELMDEWFGYDIEWQYYTYTATQDGVYTFGWSMVNDDNEWLDGQDLGFLDDVYISEAEMTTVTFETGEGGTFKNGETSVEVEYPVGYYLTPAEIPDPVPAEGYTFLGWMIEDTTEVTTFKKVQVTGPATYRAVFAKQTEGYATVILETHNVFKDGTGYQMLLDSTHEAAKYFSTMNLITNTDWESWSDYAIPNAPGNEISA